MVFRVWLPNCFCLDSDPVSKPLSPLSRWASPTLSQTAYDRVVATLSSSAKLELEKFAALYVDEPLPELVKPQALIGLKVK